MCFIGHHFQEDFSVVHEVLSLLLRYFARQDARQWLYTERSRDTLVLLTQWFHFQSIRNSCKWQVREQIDLSTACFSQALLGGEVFHLKKKKKKINKSELDYVPLDMLCTALSVINSEKLLVREIYYNYSVLWCLYQLGATTLCEKLKDGKTFHGWT